MASRNGRADGPDTLFLGRFRYVFIPIEEIRPRVFSGMARLYGTFYGLERYGIIVDRRWPIRPVLCAVNDCELLIGARFWSGVYALVGPVAFLALNGMHNVSYYTATGGLVIFHYELVAWCYQRVARWKTEKSFLTTTESSWRTYKFVQLIICCYNLLL